MHAGATAWQYRPVQKRAIAVVISGAPGSGKTTLGRLLGDAMQLPHLNKDIAAAALLRADLPYEVANKRAFQLLYETAQRWLSSSMSLVMDMTMYPEYSPREVGSLLPHGVVVNVHCRAEDALARWEQKCAYYIQLMPSRSSNAAVRFSR